MLASIFRSFSSWRGRRDAKPILRWLHDRSDGEISAVLVCTSIAHQFLLESGAVTRVFPERQFRGTMPVDNNIAQEILIYNMRLIGLRKELNRMEGVGPELTASGLTNIILSLRALAIPDLLDTGTLLWTELKRGMPGWFDHLSFVAPKPAGDPATVAALWLFPNAFARDVEEWPLYRIRGQGRGGDGPS